MMFNAKPYKSKAMAEKIFAEHGTALEIVGRNRAWTESDLQARKNREKRNKQRHRAAVTLGWKYAHSMTGGYYFDPAKKEPLA